MAAPPDGGEGDDDGDVERERGDGPSDRQRPTGRPVDVVVRRGVDKRTDGSASFGGGEAAELALVEHQRDVDLGVVVEVAQAPTTR